MRRNFDRIVEEWKEEGREQGQAEGRAQGHAEGRRTEKLEIIKRLNQLGMSLEVIASASGLSIQQTRQLVNQMHLE